MGSRDVSKKLHLWSCRVKTACVSSPRWDSLFLSACSSNHGRSTRAKGMDMPCLDGMCVISPMGYGLMLATKSLNEASPNTETAAAKRLAT